MAPEWKTYTCRYYHDGSWWGLDIVATSDADAEERARKLGNLQLLGEVVARIPAGRAGGFFVSARVGIMNWISGHR